MGKLPRHTVKILPDGLRVLLLADSVVWGPPGDAHSRGFFPTLQPDSLLRRCFKTEKSPKGNDFSFLAFSSENKQVRIGL